MVAPSRYLSTSRATCSFGSRRMWLSTSDAAVPKGPKQTSSDQGPRTRLAPSIPVVAVLVAVADVCPGPPSAAEADSRCVGTQPDAVGRYEADS
jgi:hypothetical protein